MYRTNNGGTLISRVIVVAELFSSGASAPRRNRQSFLQLDPESFGHPVERSPVDAEISAARVRLPLAASSTCSR